MTNKLIKKPLSTKMKVALSVVLLAVILLAVYLFVSPASEMRQRSELQNALIQSIEQGDGTITADIGFITDAVDYYDDGAEAPQEEAALFLPSALAAGGQAHNSTENGGVIIGLGVLSIDSIDLKLPVLEGVSTELLNIAVGHMTQTAEIGETGNAVIAGHRSYVYGMFFNRLGEVETGDIIEYTPMGGEAMTFIVDKILEIEPGDQIAFAESDDKAQITLYTCTPIRTATHRLLIRASRQTLDAFAN